MACTAIPVASLRDSRGDQPLRDPRADLPLAASLVGRVVDASGVAVTGADVRVFPVDSAAEGSQVVSINSSALADALSLVSNQSGALTGSPVSAFRSVRTIQAAATTVQTGADGTFAISVPVGRYNVECAVAGGGQKAWRGGVEIRGSGQTDLSSVTLLPTGSLEGQVRFESALATKFLGAEVFVPGSSYLAKVREDGSYVLTGIPEGAFELVAWHPEQGVGRLVKAVEVRSGEKTSVPEIVLSLELPAIMGVQDAEGRATDNGAPGTRVTLIGKNFGVSRGRPLSLSLKGQSVRDLEAVSDETLRFTVPPDAFNGDLVVMVGARVSGGFPFRVLKRLVPKSGTSPYRVGLDERFTVEDLYEVRDTADTLVREVKATDGSILSLAPNVKLKFDSPILVRDGRAIRALSDGQAVVQPEAGSLVAQFVQIEVLKSTTSPPGPAPSPDPTPVPTPLVLPGRRSAPWFMAWNERCLLRCQWHM